MIRSTLRYIRQKPKAVRNQYAFAVAGIFTAVVTVVWFTAQSPSLGADKATVSNAGSGEAGRPFASLMKQAKEQWAAVRGAVATSTESETPSVVTSPEDLDTMTLSPETVAEIAEEAVNWSPGLATTSTSVGTSSASLGPREIQIATSSKTGATSTSITP